MSISPDYKQLQHFLLFCFHDVSVSPLVRGVPGHTNLHSGVCVKRVWNILKICRHMFIGACVPCTCPVFCWHIRDWLAAGVKCRRAERLGGPVLLFAVELHLGGACHLQTHLRVGSLRHALQEREMNQEKVRGEEKAGYSRQAQTGEKFNQLTGNEMKQR